MLAGWSVVGGATGSWAVQSAESAWNTFLFSCRVTMDNSPTNCLGIKFSNGNGTQIATTNIFVIPGRDYRIIANRYQFFLFTQGLTQAREFCAGGNLFQDPVLLPSSASTDGSIWGQGNAVSDTDTSTNFSFRFQLVACNTNNISQTNTPIQYSKYGVNNYVVPASATINATPGGQRLMALASALARPEVTGCGNATFINDDHNLTAATMMWGLTGVADAAKMTGNLFDAYVTDQIMAGDTIVVIGGRQFWAITNNNQGAQNSMQGTLLVAIA